MNDVLMAVVFVTLAGLNAFQLWYWSRETHRLIDKVMSKSYPEYVSSVSYLQPKASPGRELPDETIHTQDELADLNRMLGS